MTCFPDEVKAFFKRGGAMAWGIVPNEDSEIASETAASLKDRLEEAMAPFSRNGPEFRQIFRQSLITPSCGLAFSASEQGSERCLELCVELSEKMRRVYR
jgi:hypothetical protein